METMWIEEEPLIDHKIQPIETFVEYESATDFKGFEALLSLKSTTNCFALVFKQKLDKCTMNYDDRLRRFNKTLTNWQWMSSVKKSCIHDKWLCMTCSSNKVSTLFFVKKFAHLTRIRTWTGAYLSGRLLYMWTWIFQIEFGQEWSQTSIKTWNIGCIDASVIVRSSYGNYGLGLNFWHLEIDQKPEGPLELDGD